MSSEEAQGLYTQMLKESDRAWTQSDLEGFLPPEQRLNLVELIQVLINRQQIKLLQSDGSLLYQAVAETEAAQIRGMSGDEAIVYSYVQAAGREGIWTKTIRMKSNLHQHVVNRCLKMLENKRFIKSVKSVKFPTRKIVMLYSLQPSIDVTGGPWFTDTELDSEFIALLTRLVWQYLASATFPGAVAGPIPQNSHLPGFKNYPTVEDVHEYVTNSGVSTVDLGLSDITSLCEVLVYDDKVEQLPTGGYRATWQSILDEQSGSSAHVPKLPSEF